MRRSVVLHWTGWLWEDEQLELSIRTQLNTFNGVRLSSDMFIYNIRQNLNQMQRLFLPHEPKSLLYTPFFGVCEMSYVIWVKQPGGDRVERVQWGTWDFQSGTARGAGNIKRVFKSHLKKGCLSFLPLFRKNPCEQLFEKKTKNYFLLNPDWFF